MTCSKIPPLNWHPDLGKIWLHRLGKTTGIELPQREVRHVSIEGQTRMG